MATKLSRTNVYNEGAQFDVVVNQVIGTVVLDGDGELSPYEAAFQIIARHSADNLGTSHFQFPGASGQPVEVSVTNERPDQN